MPANVGINFNIKMIDEGVAKSLQSLSNKMKGINDSTKHISAGMGSVAKNFEGPVGLIKGGFQGIEDSMKRIAFVGGAFAGIGAGLFGWAKSASGAADDIGDLATRYGVASEAIQVYGDLLKDAGGSAEDAGLAFKFLNKSMSAAMAGDKNKIDAFAGVGISVSELKKLEPEQVMMRVADAFKGSNNELAKAAVLTSLYGKNGTLLMGVMNQGAVAIGAHYDQMGKDGRLFTQKQKEDADNFEKTWQRTTGIFEGLKNTLGLQLLPVLDPIIKGFGDWAVQNKEMISGKFQEFVQNLPGYLKDIERVAIQVSSAFGQMKDAIVWLSDTFGATTLMWAGVAVLAAPLITAIGSIAAGFIWLGGIVTVSMLPIIACIGLVAAASYLWYTRSDEIFAGMDTLIADLGDAFTNMGKKIGAVWDSIVDRFRPVRDMIAKYGSMLGMIGGAIPGVGALTAGAKLGGALMGMDQPGGAGTGVALMMQSRQQVGGQIHIKIDSEGKAKVGSLQKQGGIDLLVDTGVYGMAI